MRSEKPKTTFGNIKDRPIAIIAIAIITTASITYSIINKVIVEHYKLEIKKLEQRIDQQKTIDDLNSLTTSLKNLIETQNTIVSSIKQTLKKETSKTINSATKNETITKINQSIELAKIISDMDPTTTVTFEKYNKWRSQAISIIKSADNDFETTYENDFANLTTLSQSDYQQLISKINNGILILETIKNLY